MPSSLFRLLGAATAALALAGCAGTHLAKPAENKNYAGRITSARVVWVEPIGLAFSISKTAAGYGYTPPKPVIDSTERQQAQTRIAAVLAAYRSRAPELIGRGLAAEGVGSGDETTIVVHPVSASIDAHNGAVHMAVQVSVRHSGATGPWIITPVTQNMVDGAYWNVLRKPGIGETADVDLDKLVDSFSGAVVREMKFAGWFR